MTLVVFVGLVLVAIILVSIPLVGALRLSRTPVKRSHEDKQGCPHNLGEPFDTTGPPSFVYEPGGWPNLEQLAPLGREAALERGLEDDIYQQAAEDASHILGDTDRMLWSVMFSEASMRTRTRLIRARCNWYRKQAAYLSAGIPPDTITLDEWGDRFFQDEQSAIELEHSAGLPPGAYRSIEGEPQEIFDGVNKDEGKKPKKHEIPARGKGQRVRQ